MQRSRGSVPSSAPAEDAPRSQPVELPRPPAELAAALARGEVVAWSEPLTIPTYEAGTPSPHPMYFDHRVYQGSSGRVYPIPFVEEVSHDITERRWQAVHLENSYVRIVVLPELGGRIYVGYDKTTGYDFFYRNNVIKPALVGLGGPWVSGGVEFNWPQHHRPGTYLPVEFTIADEPDGSVTIWCHDHDPFERMSAQHGIRLRPDNSTVEVTVRLHNRTSERHSFLWWANVGAYVGDEYQAFFPEDVRYVADHARRAITAFPRADRPYYGVDYPALAAQRPGADRIDFYRNIPVPTSYMIVDSQQSFFGGYDHTAGAGFVHWAERRISPGKKMWTWGNSAFGHAWDAQLTDADGPYIELMAGVYTDNQPDFAWLLPGETKTFSQFWYPIGALGPAHQATLEAAVNVSSRESAATATFAVTAPRRGATLRLLRDGELVAQRVADLVPGSTASIAEEHPGTGELVAELRDTDSRVLVRWSAPKLTDDEPEVATEPPPPAETGTVEELYLTGRHLAQYRHPTRSPLGYWREALNRDPGDVRTNLALAEHELHAGRYAEALAHAGTALRRLTRRNANPTDAEAFYLAGVALRRLGRHAEAERALGKAGWDGTWAPAAGFELAQLLARQGRDEAALGVLDTLETVVAHDARRPALRAILLRRLGESTEAARIVDEALKIDTMDAALRILAGSNPPTDPGILLDVAFDFARAGALSAALSLFDEVVAAPVTHQGNFRPLAHYAAADALEQLGRHDQAAARREAARATDLTWCFPCGLDAHDVLVSATEAEPGDAAARYLLGMLLYQHGRRVEAARLWNEAIALGLRHPVLLRNSGLASYNVTGDDELAWQRYAQAVAADPYDARIRFEQDQLAQRLGHGPAERLARLQEAEEIVLTRDDFTIEYINLLIAQGRAEQALHLLRTRQFRPWEGGEGRVVQAWDAAREALGLPAADPPPNLGEARAEYAPPVAVHDGGLTDYFATSLPDLLLFTRELPEG